MAGREYVSRFDWKISPEEQRRRDEIAQGIVQDELSAAQDVGDARSAVFLQQELSNRFKSGRVASPQSSTVESTDALFSAPEDAGGWKTIDPGWTRKSAPSDDGWTNVSDKYFYVGAKEGAQPTSGSFLSDTGNLAKIGVNQVASGLREAVRQIPGVGDSLVAGADAVDKFVTGKTSGEIFKDDNERAQGALSPNMRSALDKKWWDEENGKLGDAWLDPRAYYGGIVQSLPGTVLTMIPAGRLAKMAYEAKLATLGAEEAAKVSARTAMVAGGVGEGVLSAGQTAGDVREELAKLPQSVWDSSEAYKALIDSGMKPDEAKASLTNDAATKGFLIAGVTTALFGGQGDRVLAQAMRGSIKGGLVKRGLVGAVGEGGEEFGQSYTQEIAKNVGVQTVDPTRSATQGAMNSALGGLATGAVQGAGMNMLLGRSEPTASTVPLDQAADAPITPVISPQEIAAITPAAPVLSARETRQQAVSEQVDNLPPQREASNREARQQAVADAVTPLPDQRTGTPTPVTQPFTDAQIAASEQAIRARQVAEFDRIAQDDALNAEQQTESPLSQNGNSVGAIAAPTQATAGLASEVGTSRMVSPLSSPTTDYTSNPANRVNQPDVKQLESNSFTNQGITLSSSGQPFGSLKAAQTSIKARGLKNAVAVSVQGGFGIRLPDVSQKQQNVDTSQGRVDTVNTSEQPNAANLSAESGVQLAGRDSLPAGNQPNNGSGSERLPSSGNIGQVPGQPESVAGTRAADPVYADQSGEALAPLKEEIGWAIRGGQMQRIPGPDGTVNSETITRSKWTPKSDFWPGRPKQGGALNETQAAAAIDKAIAGQPLNTAERRFVEYAKRFAAERETLSPNASEQTEKTNKTDINEAEYEHYVQTGEPGFGWMPETESAASQVANLTDDDLEFLSSSKPDTEASIRDGMKSLGFTEQEIENEVSEFKSKSESVQRNDEAPARAEKSTGESGTSAPEKTAEVNPLEAAAKALESAAVALRESVRPKPATVAAVPAFDNASGNYNPDLPKFWIEKAKKEINGEGMSDAEYHTAVAEYANRWRVEELLESQGWKRRGSSNVSPSTYLTKEVGIGPYDAEYKTYDEYKTYEIRVSDHNDFHKPRDADEIAERFQINFRTDRADWSQVDISPSDSNAVAKSKLDGLLPNESTASQNSDARPQLDLTSPTETKLRADDAKQKRDAAEKSAKDNAPSPEGFNLTGSDRAADVGEASGQQAMFSRADTITIDGKERPRTNSNGKPIAATDEAIRNFWRWFGDSKVVDDQGRPLVVYHGTPDASFTSFKDEQYFTADPQYAARYINPSASSITSSAKRGDARAVIPVYLQIEAPFDPRAAADKRIWDREFFGKYGNGTPLSESGLPDWTDARDLAEFLREERANDTHDGLILDEGGDPELGKRPPSYLTFTGSQIKSATGNNGQFSPDNTDIRFSRAEPAPLWRSTLTEAIGKAPFKETPAPQWKAWLQSNAAKLGVKKDEIEWSGITDWLDLQQGKVSREQVQQYLDANGVKVTETELGANVGALTKQERLELESLSDIPRRERTEAQIARIETLSDKAQREDSGKPETKYASYQLPGGENYRELLLTLPEKPTTNEDATRAADLQKRLDAGEWNADPATRRSVESMIGSLTRSAYTEQQNKGFRSSHWDQPNILAHIRFNERTDADGKKVLFIEEIQSDWGQAAKKNGIALTDAEKLELQRPATNQQEWDRQQALIKRGASGVPNAPFVGKTEAWVSLALKRMIRYAVDNGFDRIAMVNGEQSAERYDLSKQVDSITVPMVNADSRSVRITPTGGSPIKLMVDNKGIVDGYGQSSTQFSGKPLDEIIGKGLADKVMAAQAGDVLSGDGLKVGGEGMKAFYDRIVPNVANDVLKKLGGGKVDSGSVSGGKIGWTVQDGSGRVLDGPFDDRNEAESYAYSLEMNGEYGKVVSTKNTTIQQPGFDITDKMREHAAQGMPMFSRSAQLSTAEDGSPVIEGGGVTLAYANPTERLEFFPTDDNQQLYNFAIMGPDNAYLGYVEAVFDNGKPIALYDISIDNAKRKTGAATATVKALLDTSPNGKLAVMNIVPSAQGFWEKLGIGIQNVEQGAAYSDTITRESFAGSPAGKNRRGASGIERGSESASRGETSQEVGFTHADAVDLASKLSEAGLSGVTVVRTVADMPATERDTVLSRVPDGKIRGAYFRDTDKVILVSSEIHSPKEALFVISHEALHRGIANTLGSNAKPILKGMYDTNANLRKLTQQQMDRYGIGQEEAIEEALADMPVSDLQNLKGWDKLVALIRSWLGKLADATGFKIEWSDDMVATFVAGMRRNGLRDGVSVLEPDTIEVDGKTRPTKNSNGQAIHPTEEGVRNFWKWFGDSRVVDDQGRPLVVYHGTREPGITKFYEGGHFGDAGQAAERLDVIQDRKGSDTVYPVYLKILDPMRTGDAGDVRTWDAYINHAARLGNDGIVYENSNEGSGRDSWLVWSDDQIKSATGNTGQFSQDNADIRFSRPGDLFDPKQTDAQSAYNGAEVVQGLGSGIKSILKTTANMARDRRGAALQFLGGRQIADIYTKDVPELPKYNERLQIMQAEQNEGSAVADAIIDKWRVLNRKRPEVASSLSALMHDATLAQFDPDTKKSELSVEFSDLRKRWVNLPQEGKDIYREARDAYAAHFEKVKAELLDRVQRSALDTSAKQRTLDKMREEFTKSMKGVYFPLARFGDYMVIVKDSSGVTKSVNMAETTNQAQQMRAELIRAYPNDVVGAVQKKKEFNAERDGVSRGFMKDLVALINEEPDAQVRESQLDAINQLWLSSLPDLSWAKSGIHRKGTPGYSNDAMRAFARNMFHGGYHLAKLRHGDRLADTLSQMQETIDSKIKADPNYSNVVAQSVVDEMNARHQHVMNPQNTPVANALTGLGFMWHMGLSPASAVVNLSQTALVAYPMLASKFGFTKAAKMLLSLSADAVKGKNDLLSQLKGKEREAYDRAVKEGLIDLTMAHDLAGVSQGKSGAFNENQQRVMRVASMMFHEAEKFNRGVTFMAAYRMATESGVSDPYKLAHDLTYDSHFDYSATNRPRIMQGPTARVILLFKQYGQNMIYTLARNTAKSLQGDKEAMKTLGGLLAMHGMFAGALGLPLMTTLLAAASAIGGSEDEPWDAQVALRNYLAQTFGKDMGEVLAHGVFRAPGIKDAIGGDISGRVGLDSLLIRMPQETLEGKKYYQALLETIAGPVFGIGGNIANGMQTMSQGNTLRGIEEMLPKSIKDPLKAYRYDQEGIQDKTGITIVDETTIPEEVAQFLGFSAARGMEGFEGKSAIKNQETLLTQRRKQLMQRYTREREEGDATDSQEAIQRWNRANPTMAIKGEDLMRSVREKARRQAEAENGVYLTKKRRGLAELGEFANVD